MKQLFILSILFCSISASAQILPKYGDSRSGTTGFQFLKIAPDARSIGMGEAFTAITNDVSAVYWNAAGLTKLDTTHYHLQLGNTAYFSNLKMQHIAFAKKIKPSVYLAAHLIYLNSGYMNVATEFAPQGNGQQFNYNNIDAGLSLAKALTDNFSFGFTVKYIHEGIATVRAKNIVADFGFQYEIGKGNTRFAVGISNFGSPTKAGGNIIKTTFTGEEKITEFEKINVPAIFRLGVATDVYKKNNQMLTIAAQLNHPTDNNESINLGAEYIWHKTFYGRMGYQFGADEIGLPNFGFGLVVKRKFGGIRIDYGFQAKKILGTVHRVTLTADVF
ncbi:MAG: hypothetical protein RL065_678 [Bacteroidota bacterium]|jgi:hypothetical protein